jgi:metallophosphoesterase (TIGR00282 family)
MKILFIGDIVAGSGRKKICSALPEIIKKENIFFTIAQGENLAGGIGITEKTAKELFKAGVNCITTGNHVWKYKDVYPYLDSEIRLLRPANYPEGIPGRGYYVYEKKNIQIGVINLEGRVFMNALEDPFKIGKITCQKMYRETKNIFIDFHAEATSEKKALGFYLSEFVTGFIGTHTHVQTADEYIMNNKTAYITDVGMVGAPDSVIGVVKKDVINYFRLSIPQKFKTAKGDIVANCVIIDFDENLGKATSITRYNF